MKKSLLPTSLVLCAATVALSPSVFAQTNDKSTPVPLQVIPSNVQAMDLEARTPQAPATPRINGANIFGVRPGNPFLYHIPATGERPMTFSADGLPKGLKIDAVTGNITGSLADAGKFSVTLHAKNSKGTADKKFTIVVGEEIALTPPMGWNSWNAYHAEVTGEDVMHAARAMVSSGLINHGFCYINIDDSWQGKRGGQFNGIQPNEKFPNIQQMCEEIHAMGLKAGIYSGPWITTYAGYVGERADNAEGTWAKPADKTRLHG